MLYAFGAADQVVATDLTSNYPAEADGTPKIDAFNFNIEEVAALDPDLVIIAFDFQDEAEQLASLGIPFLLLGPPPTLEESVDQLEALGRATGHGVEADALAAGLRARIEDVRLQAEPLGGLTFFHEVDETLYSTTSDSFLGDLYSQLGMVNIADAVGAGNPYPQLSPEYIITQDPWLVVLGDAGFGVTVDSVATRPGWAALSAVQTGNVVALDSDIAGRWGPRTVDLMEAVLKAALEALG